MESPGPSLKAFSFFKIISRTISDLKNEEGGGVNAYFSVIVCEVCLFVMQYINCQLIQYKQVLP